MSYGSPLFPKIGGGGFKLGTTTSRSFGGASGAYGPPTTHLPKAPSSELMPFRQTVVSQINKRAYRRFTAQPRFPNAMLLFGKEQNTKVPM